jgi:hypothetical protein
MPHDAVLLLRRAMQVATSSAISLPGLCTEACYLLSRCHLQQGFLDEADAALQQAITYCKACARLGKWASTWEAGLQLSRATLLQQLHRISEADQLFRSVLQSEVCRGRPTEHAYV